MKFSLPWPSSKLKLPEATVSTNANGFNNSQHCRPNNVGSCCVRLRVAKQSESEVLPRAGCKDTSSVWNFTARFSDVFWRETSGGLAKCRLFSQASESLASITLCLKLFIASDRSRCGGYLWHGQYGIYIKSFFRYAFKFVQIQ